MTSRATGVMAFGDEAVLLTLWEEAASVPDCAVGAVVVRHTTATGDLATVLDLPLSELTALLAGVYVDRFGASVQAVTTCPGCGQDLEVDLPLGRLCALPPPPARADLPPLDGAPALVVRCPTTRDLLAAAGSGDPEATLAAACVTGEDGAPVELGRIGPRQRAAVEAAAELLAGVAAAVLTSRCTDCGTEVRADVDVASLLWQRVRGEVPALLGDVAELAMAFGWSEDAVLAMSPVRRAAYLELARDRP